MSPIFPIYQYPSQSLPQDRGAHHRYFKGSGAKRSAHRRFAQTRYRLASLSMRLENPAPKKSEIDITRLLQEMRLEAAVRPLKHSGGAVDSAAVKALILGYETQAGRAGSG
jgi:hypothetical protein